MRDAGYDVIAFDGPGQGAMLEDSNLPMHLVDWERPVTAVFDHFNLEDGALLGVSLGGCLTVRAAAKESPVTRVVCDDVLVPFFAVLIGQFPATVRRALRLLLTARASALVALQT